jgi:four helix bundle protein
MSVSQTQKLLTELDMRKIEKFEDIEAWQRARKLVKVIYDISKKGEFSQDFKLRAQIRDAVVSIMANIAEGFGRRSDKEFANFLNYSHASCAEVQSHLYVALDQDYIHKDLFQNIYNECDEISRMILSFQIYLRKS